MMAGIEAMARGRRCRQMAGAGGRRQAGRLQAASRELAALRERTEARTGFIATLAHELREPLNGVLGMARLLRETALDAEQEGYLAALNDAGEALLALIGDAIDLTRIDAGRIELLDATVELRPFLERFIAATMTRARQRGLKLTLAVDPSAPRHIRADPGRLRQVLANLVGNGLKFTEQGGVAVTAAAGPAPVGQVGLRLKVVDTGPGIPPEASERLFGAFAQADPSVRRLYGGSGLGLMIAKRLTEAMGGRIALDSGRHGTTFTIDLVLPPADIAEPGHAAAPLAGASLLVVDALSRTRETMVELARGWGLAVRGARGMAQALAFIEEAADRGEPFDVVIADQILPDGGAEQLAEIARRQPRLAHTRLVLLAGAGVRGDAARARARGFAAYLPKPPAADALLACLRRLVADHETAGQPLITIHSLVEDRPRPLRVLVADDNPVNCRLMEIILERQGHTVTVARDGQEAVTAAAGGDFDLVLMDVRMPELDGLAATARIRALPDQARAHVPIVAVTANAMRDDAERCIASGMTGYLTKPVDTGTLLATVDRVTRSHPQSHSIP